MRASSSSPPTDHRLRRFGSSRPSTIVVESAALLITRTFSSSGLKSWPRTAYRECHSDDRKEQHREKARLDRPQGRGSRPIIGRTCRSTHRSPATERRSTRWRESPMTYADWCERIAEIKSIIIDPADTTSPWHARWMRGLTPEQAIAEHAAEQATGRLW